VVTGVYEGISTTELDNLASEIAAAMTTTHPDYETLASRIAISNLHKETKPNFSSVVEDLYKHVDPRTKKHAPLVSKAVYDAVMAHAKDFDSTIIHDRDFSYTYFGFKTLERSYLLRIDGKIVERPQYMLMRVAVGIHGNDTEAVLETYLLLSEKYFTHASPTLFNGGTDCPQMSSCFLITPKGNSLEEILDTFKDCATISMRGGGIGIVLHNVPNLIPILRLLNNIGLCAPQGGGKRPAGFAIYIEPHHKDIFEFLNLRKNTGKEEYRARDLFYALWVSDLFMKRVEADEDWSLFDPQDAPDLNDVYGEKFEELYKQYEKEGRACRTIKAQALWQAIVDTQIETGMPYMLYKDACNRKSNQKNLGTIKCSNLCTEIVEYTAPDEIAVCNLASLALPKFVRNREFDFELLHNIAKVVTRNLNKIIDLNLYPVDEAKRSNLRHRPIGLGVQGLADTFIMMRFPFDSQEARELNIKIFETIYHAALEASCELAEQDGPYETYAGSPISEGQLQYDLWGVAPTDSWIWDWAALKDKIKKHGVRNSLLVAPMPTASTSQILGFNECFEPYTSNIYTRRVLSGEFQIVNKWLIRDLITMGIWNDKMKNAIIANYGSIQNIAGIPDEIKALYKTVWEISQKVIIDMAADRGIFICQSQSLNLFLSNPEQGQITRYDLLLLLFSSHLFQVGWLVIHLSTVKIKFI